MLVFSFSSPSRYSPTSRGAMRRSSRPTRSSPRKRLTATRYAGRSLDESEPRYKLPAGFHKSQVLFNLHRVTGLEAIVVEGFFDCMKVWQAGYSSVVALMGSALSEHQELLLLGRFKKVTLLLDGDDTGRKAAEEIAGRLTWKVHVRIVKPPGAKQPDQLEAEQINALLR
jgi:DNA primase